MTIQEILDALDKLSDEDIPQIKHHIQKREQRSSITPEAMQAIWSQAPIQAQLQAILAQSRANPPQLRAGTMDVEALRRGFEAMREGLSEEDLIAIEQAMNEEYIEDDDSLFADFIGDAE